MNRGVAGLLTVFGLGLLLAVTAAYAAPPGMRYCDAPGVAGEYVAATPNVSCRTARRVSRAMFSSRCVNRARCGARGFTCRSHYAGRYGQPFSYTHHGTCHKGKRHRIEFDGG
jgi:hypothetical protein